MVSGVGGGCAGFNKRGEPCGRPPRKGSNVCGRCKGSKRTGGASQSRRGETPAKPLNADKLNEFHSEAPAFNGEGEFQPASASRRSTPASPRDTPERMRQFASKLADRGPLGKRCLAPKKQDDFINTQELLQVMLDPDNAYGFSVSPFSNRSEGAFTPEKPPDKGFAVAVLNTDLRNPAALVQAAASKADKKAAMRGLDDWLINMRPMFKTGNAWIGGWLDTDTGERMVEVTLVINPDQPRAREFAERLGNHQDQKAIFDLTKKKDIKLKETNKGGIPYTADDPGTRMYPTPDTKVFYS